MNLPHNVPAAIFSSSHASLAFKTAAHACHLPCASHEVRSLSDYCLRIASGGPVEVSSLCVCYERLSARGLERVEKIEILVVLHGNSRTLIRYIFFSLTKPFKCTSGAAGCCQSNDRPAPGQIWKWVIQSGRLGVRAILPPQPAWLGRCRTIRSATAKSTSKSISPFIITLLQNREDHALDSNQKVWTTCIVSRSSTKVLKMLLCPCLWRKATMLHEDCCNLTWLHARPQHRPL